MKTKSLLLLASLFGAVAVLGGCTCPNKHYANHQHMQCDGRNHKNCAHAKQKMNSPQVTETVVFYQTYEGDDVNNVRANMFTRSSRGGESPMGTIKFKETNSGLKMMVDLIDLRPGKTYTAHIYQCGACNDSTCCDTAPMAIDLPQLRIEQRGRLQKSYIVRGLAASQLNNAKLILTRDGGYKAAWGTLNQ